MSDRILIVDDEANIRNSISSLLSDEGYECYTAANGREAQAIIDQEEIHLIITDLVMPEMDGMQLLQWVRQKYHSTKVFLLTAYGTVESAVQAMKFGAVEFLLKPVDFDTLLLKVKEHFHSIEMQRELKWLKDQCRQGSCVNCLKLVGESQEWKAVLKQAEKAAKSAVTILITGESGSGKELLARLIHKLSPRSAEPFIPLNCGGLPDTLLESELFGVVKGAFSGAVRDRDGLIRAAKKGTLFLDEISELSANSQAKLLRVLQDGEVRPLGSDKVIQTACRFLAATNKNLIDEVLKKNFRHDLYYRISSFVIHIPPLRERLDDIPLLAKHFVYCQSVKEGRNTPIITSDALSILQTYNWPGNVRQLENVIKHALIINEGEYLTVDSFPQDIFKSTSKIPDWGLKEAVSRFERSYIIRLLKENGNDKKAAAEKLGISLTTLYQKIKDLNIPASALSEKPE